MDSQSILEQELKTFSWNEVDQFPSFESCEDIINFNENKICFENTLSTYVSEVLQQNQNVVLPFVTDTIDVRFLVSTTGVLRLSELATHTTKDRSTADLKTVLRSALNDLPTLYPAIKRGQHVQVEFVLPIILNAK